jgi:hypothetical protein
MPGNFSKGQKKPNTHQKNIQRQTYKRSESFARILFKEGRGTRREK